MDEQLRSSNKSTGSMSLEEFQSKNSCFTKYKGDTSSLIHSSNQLAMSFQHYEGPQQLLKKLSGSDSNKMPSQKSMKQQPLNKRSSLLGKSNQAVDKIKIGLISDKIEVKNQELFESEQINHECDCIKYKKTDYCPFYCSCFNAPQKCSQNKCCKACFESKQSRLPEIMQKIHQQSILSAKNNKKVLGSIYKKSQPDVDVGMYIDGGKKQPKKFREQRCECRNSKCENKYCVCFTAGNKCTIKCLCQNCRNSDFVNESGSGSSSRSVSKKPYLEYDGSNESIISNNMDFEPVVFQ